MLFRTFVGAFVAATLLPWATLGQELCKSSLPEPLNLSAKRQELFSAYPAPSGEFKMSELRRQGSLHADFEAIVILGWQREIEERCFQVKDAEAEIELLRRNGQISPNDFRVCTLAISQERAKCDVRNKETSTYYVLERDLRQFNTKKFEELQRRTLECSRNDECREK